MNGSSEAGKAAPFLLKCLLALVFGMALTTSFAPTDAWWFAPYCVAGLLLLLRTDGCSAFCIGACFGFGWFGAGFWWIVPALEKFSEAGLLFSFQLTAALIVYLSLFPACAAVLIAYCRRTEYPGFLGRLRTATLIALIFACSECARGNLFSGFPMLATGYSHTQGPLTGFAPLVGVYGLTFFNTWVAAMMAAACWQQRVYQSGRLYVETVALLALLAASGLVLRRIDWSQDSGRTLSVSLLQGNLAQSDKFSKAGLSRAANIYLQLAAAGRGQLTVLPETALPMEWSAMPAAVTARFQKIADVRKTTVVIGTVAFDTVASRTHGDLTNSAIALFPNQGGSTRYRYNKRHLVPFAEFLPPGSGWMAQRLELGVNGLLPGRPGQPPLRTAGAQIGITICFENLFDTEVADKARDAEMLLNLTNFAWFLGSNAHSQHLQVAQMRAMETARWFVQASNTGMTALIDAKGVIRHQLQPDQIGILEGQVALLSGSTPFMIVGNWPLLIVSVFATLRVVLIARRPSVARLPSPPQLAVR